MHKQNEPASQECMCWPSVSYPHHHHRHVVCRAPLHCLVGQPVARSFIAGINSRFPLSGLDLFILKAGQDEVHSFLWGKDLEEPITGQQNEPVIGGQLTASDIRHRCDPTALVLPISNGTGYLQHTQDTPISKMRGTMSDSHSTGQRSPKAETQRSW